MQAQQQQAEGETQAEEPQEPITYTTETKTMTATMPVDPITNTAWTTDGMTKLSYEQLVPSRQSDAVDKINATIEQAIQDTAAVTSAKAEQQASGSADEQVARNVCTDRLIYVTYLTDSVVCFFDLSYVTGYGPHGWAERGGIAFSLETGEQVSMSSVAGVDQSELIDLTCTAEETYLAANPKAYSTISSKVLETTRKTLTDNQGKLKKTTPGLEDEECFCLGEDGMYYLTSDYEMGSYADGTRNICIAAFSDQSLVGTSAKLEKGI